VRFASHGLFHYVPLPIGTAINWDSFGCLLVEGREKGMAVATLQQAPSQGLTLGFIHGVIGSFFFELAWDPYIGFLLRGGSARFGRVHFGLSRWKSEC
jgi:hypothetical protein